MVPGTPADFAGSFLEHYSEPGGPPERIPLIVVPFTIGRAETANHVIYSNKVSKEHAAIVIIGGRYAVRDLESTNGTFVNGRRVGEELLADGDIIHVAHVEFCFRDRPAAPVASPVRDLEKERTTMVQTAQPDSLIRGSRLITELIEMEAAEILYQPIVDLQTRQVRAFEALGRGTHPDLSSNPEVLFQQAEQCGLVIELSQMFAKRAVEGSHKLPPGTSVFVNIHARQIERELSQPWLATLRALAHPDHPIVIEIAEASVTSVSAMAVHKAMFSELGLGFAYDDFGAGQARLLELIDVPPDYLKLDKSLLQGIDRALPRQEIVGALVKVVSSLGVQVVAEGIESEDVAQACAELGCSLGQGYLFGHPE